MVVYMEPSGQFRANDKGRSIAQRPPEALSLSGGEILQGHDHKKI